MSKQSARSYREQILKISTGGICLALSFVLSQLKLFEMPMGGTVTPASTLPIIVYGVAFGPVWGFLISFIFSLLQLIGGWLVTPFQVFLDYTVGYTALGFAGFAAMKSSERIKNSGALARFRGTSLLKIIAFSVVAYLVRWLGSVASGVIFYSEYAADAGYDSALVYSMVYNGSFLLADLAILSIVLVVFYMVIPSSSKKDNTVVSIQKYTAEFIGTFVLVFAGCGTAMTVGCDSANGGGYILTALAFGLVIVAMAYCIGNISGCHINPAVSLAMLISGKMTISDFWGYVVFQILGAISGAGLLQYLFGLSGKVDMTGVYDESGELVSWGLGTNGLAGVNGDIPSAVIIELILTFIFVLCILGVTDSKFKHGSFGGLIIGLALVLVHIMGIGFTGTSVNPARSIGPALIAGGSALSCLWVFIIAPLAGGALAALIYMGVSKGFGEETETAVKAEVKELAEDADSDDDDADADESDETEEAEEKASKAEKPVSKEADPDIVDS